MAMAETAETERNFHFRYWRGFRGFLSAICRLAPTNFIYEMKTNSENNLAKRDNPYCKQIVSAGEIGQVNVVALMFIP